MLIYDEAQTGLGKLGTTFGYQIYIVQPDILTISKHLGGGLTVSATVTTDAIAEPAIANGFTCGHSHSSDPLACKAGAASIDEIVENDLPKRALQIRRLWQDKMRVLQQRYEVIGDIRGRGLLQGGELVRDRRTKEPAAELAANIYRQSMADGLMFSVCGRHKNVLRSVPPFSSTDEQIENATEILGSAIRNRSASGDGHAVVDLTSQVEGTRIVLL